MRPVMSAFLIAIAAGALAVPAAFAQNDSDSQSLTTPDGHPKQHQDVKPMPQDPASKGDAAKPDQSAPNQSALAPQSSAVITPPTTGDQSVITPPNQGAAKMPVIPPPGTPGDNNNVVPK
jgi:hypothetical protein